MLSRKTVIILIVIIAIILLWSVQKAVSNYMGRAIVEKAIENASDGTVKVDSNNDGSMDLSTDEGTISTGKSLPKDWPTDIPPYTGAEISYAATMTPVDAATRMALILGTTDASADVQSFYEAALKREGWTMTNTIQGGGTIIMTATKDKRVVSLSLATSNGQTIITIGVEGSAE